MRLRRHLWWLVRAELAAIAALALWFGGRIERFADDWRFVAALVVMVLWGVGERIWGARAEPAAEPDGAAVAPREQAAAEAALIRGGLGGASAMLRRLPISTRGRYALPRYLVLGPDGAGKSALLANSGLAPVEPATSGEPTRGVAPVVTGEALFFDLAGAYVGQAQPGPAERAGWRALIGGLATQRPLLPLNGVILALSPADLVLADSTERAELALGIRARLSELERALKLRLPVYVVLTKLDLTPGFVEYFDRLDIEQRSQAWGFSFPYDEAAAASPVVAGFGPAFDALLDDLKRRQLDLLHREADRRRAAMILGFPAQLAALKPMTEEILDIVFGPDERARGPLLRAVYFTSARQDLLTIDRLLPVMADRFALPPDSALPPDLASEEGALGWFITRPLREAILPEAGLVFRQRNPYRPRQMAYWATGVAAVAACAVAGSALAVAFETDLRKTQQLSVALESRAAQPLRPGLGGDVDLLRTVTVTLPPDLPEPIPPLPARWTFDPGHAGHLRRAFATAAADIVERRVLPRLAGLVQTRLADDRVTGAALGSAIGLYRVLGGIDAPEAGALGPWLSEDAPALLPGADAQSGDDRRVLADATETAILARHPALTIDRDLLAAAQARLPGQAAGR